MQWYLLLMEMWPLRAPKYTSVLLELRSVKYDTKEYNTLTNPQKEGLIHYRIKLAGKGKKLRNPNEKRQFDRSSSNDRTSSIFKSKKFKRAVSQAVEKKLKKMRKRR